MSEDPVLRPTVLNVNDSPANLYTTSRILIGAGFRVIEAVDGGSALEQAKTRPDLMLLDVQVPDISGIEVCRQVKENESTASIAVLMTSANYVTLESKVLGLEHAADGYLAQPFEAAELVAMVRSLVRLRHAEQESRKRNDRLVEADRRKDEFLAMLAHELRNPLAAATTALYLLEKSTDDPARQARSKDVIRRQLGNLGRLVDELVDVSRVTRGKIELRKESVDLSQLVQRAVALTRERWGTARGQQIELTTPPFPVLVFGDVMRLEQIFNNLLDNASKYSEKNGRITVTVAVNGPASIVRVKDDGMGLALEAVADVFGLFYQVDQSAGRARGGLGIGLTLVRTLVELHEGTVAAGSAGLGKGSEFSVRLPTVVAAQPVADADFRPTVQNVVRRILVVDDQVDVRDTLREFCESLGYNVRAARDGYTGVQLALDWHPEIALIDIGLPGIDGFEVARRIRADSRGRDIRLIALTGYGAESQRNLAIAAGFEIHLVKPVDPGRLALLLSSAAPAIERASEG